MNGYNGYIILKTTDNM